MIPASRGAQRVSGDDILLIDATMEGIEVARKSEQRLPDTESHMPVLCIAVRGSQREGFPLAKFVATAFGRWKTLRVSNIY